MKRIIQALMAFFLSLFYGFCAVLAILRMVYRHGFSKTFRRCHIEKPSILSDPKFGVHGFLHLEDIRVHYVASGADDKPLMLFIHGFPDFWFSWRHQIEEFQKDYRVVAFDMRGYGESDKPSEVRAYTMDKLTSDVRQVILALGYQRCVLVGHDWGGAIAWVFGHQFPDMVDRLIIMNAPPSRVMAKLFAKSMTQIAMSWYVFFFQLPWLPEFTVRLNNFVILDQMFGVSGIDGPLPGIKYIPPKELSKNEIDAYKFTFSQPGALSPPINYYRAALRSSRRLYDLTYSMPVLLIWGLKDFALHSDIPVMVQKENPSIHVKTIPEAAHFVQTDCPQEVNVIMRNWLQETSK